MFIRLEEIKAEEVEKGVTRKILGYDDQLMMVYATFKKGSVGYVHTHPHRQVTYIAEGSFEVFIDGKKETLKKGDCYFIPPELPHGTTALKDGILIDVFTPVREDFLEKQ